MTAPSNLGLFPFSFPGFGPDLSRGLAVVTGDKRLVLAEAAGNPGTAVINALETALAAARTTFDVPEDSPVFYWEPDGADDGEAVWEVDVGEDEVTLAAVDWKNDVQLLGAVEALRAASGSAR
jgi:hypothetical protein